MFFQFIIKYCNEFILHHARLLTENYLMLLSFFDTAKGNR